jgi:hypothetical protein
MVLVPLSQSKMLFLFSFFPCINDRNSSVLHIFSLCWKVPSNGSIGIE